MSFFFFVVVVERTAMSIELVCGPMFSGKTTELLRRMRRHMYANRRCVVLKHAKDVRYDASKCCTHDGASLEAVQLSELSQFSDVDRYDVVGIDEGQFFPDIVEFCERVANAGKLVIVAALDGDCRRKPFGHIPELMPVAESVVKLNAVCSKCGTEAAFTRRFVEDARTEVVGGSEIYEALCRRCHIAGSCGSPRT